MNTLDEIKAVIENHRIEGKRFIGAQAYSNKLSAQLSSQYNVQGLTTSYFKYGELVCIFLCGREVVKSVST